ncbi:hypothetical protein [Streptomyces sp. NPDC090135]|uniref:hypothetical protein n=1 Tax=Streptomyces sp. NPDC090135 TaxID=3365957 RepID=UPI00382F1B55
MNGLQRRDCWLLAVAVTSAAGMVAAILVGLDSGQDRSSLKVADVEGVWSGSSGQRLTVRADGSAELERVREPDTGCGQSASEIHLSYSGAATWIFDTWPDERPGILFTYEGAGTGKACSVYLSILNTDIGIRGFFPHEPDVRYERDSSHLG